MDNGQDVVVAFERAYDLQDDLHKYIIEIICNLKTNE
jgi:hypothetical protein